jgi:hypothetical protein
MQVACWAQSPTESSHSLVRVCAARCPAACCTRRGPSPAGPRSGRCWAGGRLPASGGAWGAAGILAGTSALASLNALGDYGKIRALDRHGTRTTAVIDSQHSKYVHIPSGYSGTITTLELRFTDADGTEIRGTCGQSGRSSFRSGFPLPVIYDPRKPRVVHRVDPNGHPEASYQFEEFCWLAVGILGMVVLALRLVI